MLQMQHVAFVMVGAVADAIADALTYAVSVRRMNTFSDMCNAHCALCIGSDILVTETETISHDKFKQKYMAMGIMYRTILFTNFHFTLKKYTILVYRKEQLNIYV